MILEVAHIKTHAERESEFEEAMRQAAPILMASAGYIGHDIHRCVENPSQYILFVRWQTLEDHMQGFRGSSAFTQWRAILNPHFAEPPQVLHYNQTHAFGQKA